MQIRDVGTSTTPNMRWGAAGIPPVKGKARVLAPLLQCLAYLGGTLRGAHRRTHTMTRRQQPENAMAPALQPRAPFAIGNQMVP